MHYVDLGRKGQRKKLKFAIRIQVQDQVSCLRTSLDRKSAQTGAC